MPTAPCHRSKNPAFTDPTPLDSPANRAAVTMCEHCPIRQRCAEDALTAGTTLDEHPGPASDVIQGGVVCRGDLTTAWALAEVAGVPVPAYWAQKPARAHVSDRCVNCDHPMFKWTRGDVPEGYVRHYARNHCENCRTAYRQKYPAGHSAPRLRKQVDRRRHSAPKKPTRPAVVQLPLFGLEIVA